MVKKEITGVKWLPLPKSELKKAREEAEKAGDWGTASKGNFSVYCYGYANYEIMLQSILLKARSTRA